MSTPISSRANAIGAIVLSLLPLPALKLLDHVTRSCGDGLCGFSSGLLILLALGGATLLFLARSVRQRETPAVLRLVPVTLWVLAFIPLFF